MSRDLLVKDFGIFWRVYLSPIQTPIPGACFIEARREALKDTSQLLRQESDKLFGEIVPAWKNAVTERYSVTSYKLEVLSDESPLRVHLQPLSHSGDFTRYEISFPTSIKSLSPQVLGQIKEDLLEYFPKDDERNGK